MIHLNNVGFFPLTVTGKPVGEKKAHLKTTCDKVAQIFFCFVLLCLDLYFPFFLFVCLRDIVQYVTQKTVQNSDVFFCLWGRCMSLHACANTCNKMVSSSVWVHRNFLWHFIVQRANTKIPDLFEPDISTLEHGNCLIRCIALNLKQVFTSLMKFFQSLETKLMHAVTDFTALCKSAQRSHWC